MINENSTCFTEIVTLDTYKLKSLDFVPDVVLDIGASIGVFSWFARSLWPDAWIIAIEPHEPNFFALLQNLGSWKTHLSLRGLGVGTLWRYPDVNRSDDETSTGETYISSPVGYEMPDIGIHPLLPVRTESVMLDELVQRNIGDGQRYIVKIDCEGAENVIWGHQPSIDVLRKADYVTMELHPYWVSRELYKFVDGQPQDDADALAAKVTSLLCETHNCTSEPPMFYARKK